MPFTHDPLARATPRVLIVAGSDSGGGAGIQADIKTVSALGGHAMTAITAITAQNTLGVQAVHPLPPEIVLAQIDSVTTDIGIDAVKIGMLGSPANARAVADWLEEVDVPVVFDPVMVATSGATLVDDPTIAAFDRLAARATLITPNTPELARLAGTDFADVAGQQRAAEAYMLRTRARAILAKGGHLPRDDGFGICDTLYQLDEAGWREHFWENTRLDTRHTHGTGCTLASAIATGLGAGLPLAESVARAIRFVRLALERAPGLGHGHGPMGQQFVTAQCLA